jgi:hypothetical protein
MAKEEKPLEYQRRIRDTKGVAQRLDLNYLRRPALLLLLRKRLTWAVVAVCAIAAIPLVRGWGGSRPVSAAHAIFENKCESCHTVAFAAVPNSACKTCHDGAPHTMGAKDNPPPCSQCHLEHEGRVSLAKVSTANCTGCHARNEKQQKRVSAFRPGRHPEFSTASMKDERPIKLNHAIHMPQTPKTIRGMKLPMRCEDCHVTDRNSRTGDLIPVTFEQNCKSCHARELEFDVRQVLGPAAPPAPHTRDAKAIHEFVVAAYRGMPDAESLVKESEDYLFGRKCGYCHEGVQANGPVSNLPHRAIGGRYPSGAPWFERAEFDHRTHRAVACDSCHAAARASTKTADVLIPKFENCQPCHGDSHAELDRCGVCHVYHKKNLEKDVERKFGGTR